MQKLRKIALLSLLSILVVGIAFGVLKYTEKISNTANVIGYEAKLIRTDTSAIVTAIPWGDIEQGLNKTTEEVFEFTKKLVMKNTGDFDAALGWKLNSTLPNGATLKMEYYNLATSLWDELPQNIFDDYPGTWGGSLWSKGASTNFIRFVLIVPNDMPRGAFTFDILLLTATTISG